ncbi:MAG TPA: Hpt domain-containing protein [Thermodesulfobacteriota bacterium]|nr:Hpt domain-containing protein [Deltaproteobacteria bacterium]HOC38518.1 Hpt domain-containing protein [Thermodesulfobacteriota bacterium]
MEGLYFQLWTHAHSIESIKGYCGGCRVFYRTGVAKRPGGGGKIMDRGGDRAAALGLGEDEFVELTELFLDTCITDLQSLECSLVNQDIGRAMRAAHSMKGASGNLGFEELWNIARAIELTAKQGRLAGIESRIAEFRKELNVLRKELGRKG